MAAFVIVASQGRDSTIYGHPKTGEPFRSGLDARCHIAVLEIEIKREITNPKIRPKLRVVALRHSDRSTVLTDWTP
jgi:hypothetical protein